MRTAVPLLGNSRVDPLLQQWDRDLLGETPAVAWEARRLAPGRQSHSKHFAELRQSHQHPLDHRLHIPESRQGRL